MSPPIINASARFDLRELVLKEREAAMQEKKLHLETQRFQLDLERHNEMRKLLNETIKAVAYLADRISK
eukprot:gene7306-7676_t